MTQGEPDKGQTQGLGEGRRWEVSTEIGYLLDLGVSDYTKKAGSVLPQSSLLSGQVQDRHECKCPIWTGSDLTSLFQKQLQTMPSAT